jgi:hypothetical protein
MTKEKKPQMRDLSVNPENEMDIETAVQKLKERHHRAMLIRDKRNEEFSMFRTKKLAGFWLVGGLLLAFAFIEFMNVLLSSMATPL